MIGALLSEKSLLEENESGFIRVLLSESQFYSAEIWGLFGFAGGDKSPV